MSRPTAADIRFVLESAKDEARQARSGVDGLAAIVEDLANLLAESRARVSELDAELEVARA
tara:strand:- start:34856 stop:35038 length:183 start_codon:yes stop_codon:yes gene_type:complete